tara:strand:+ start:630 stop:1907 length:1278 start_codon:yes stop_codon:yes gene_type:complete
MAHKYGFASVNSQLNTGRDNQSTTQQQLNALASNMISARVTDIILDDQHPKFGIYGEWSSVGTIFFEAVEGSPSISSKIAKIASPLIPYLKNYPLVNELVLLFLLPNNQVNLNSNTKKYFYINPISIWNTPHLNAYPNLQANTQTQPSQQKSYRAIEQGQTRKSSDEEVEYAYNSPLVGGTFIERSNIHPLLAFAGDIITEGRWGNSIRLGSTAKTDSILYGNDWSNTGEDGNPITIIRNGQPKDASKEGYLPIIENINKDLSSIYLTSNQTIPLTTTITNNPSIKNNKPEAVGSFQGSQVILNSNRLVFNANSTGSILLNSEGSISLTSINTVGIYSQESDIVLQSSKNNIRLGDPTASESVVLGDTFLDDLADLLRKLQTLGQTLSTEPKIYVSTGPASSLKGQATKMLDNIKNYKSKIVKSI